MTSEPTIPEQTAYVPRYARADVIGGAVMVFIAGLVWYGAIELKLGAVIDFGPGFMPRVLAIILFVAGGAVLIRGLVQSGETAEPLKIAARPPLILSIAIVLFALFVRGGDFGFFTTPRLGLMVVGPLTVIISGLATPEANHKELVVMAFGLTAATMLVFPDLLGVSLPVFPGFIEAAIPPSFGTGNALRVLYVAYGVLTAGLYILFFKMPEMRRD